MEITVFLEPLDSRGYRAVSQIPTRLEAEGATREKALEHLSLLLQKHLAHGELVRLKIPVAGEENPLLSLSGILKDHPDFDVFVNNMKEYRRQVDADPDRP